MQKPSASRRTLTNPLGGGARRARVAKTAAFAVGAGTVAAGLMDRLALAVALAAVLLGSMAGLLLRATQVLHRRLTRLQQLNSAMVEEVRTQTRTLAEAVGRTGRNERDVLTAIREERRAAAERHTRLGKMIDRSRREITGDTTRLYRSQLRETEALLQLFRDFSPRAAMPSSGHWALNPTDLLGVLSLIERRRPSLVVELGSGTSTVWMAYLLERVGGRLVSLDHERQYAEQTRAMLSAHNLENVAEVRDAPLRPVTVRGNEFNWYGVEALTDLSEVDFVLVDGPPGALGPLSRYPALEVLKPRLARTATIVLDDLSREDEQETVRRWVAEIPEVTRDRVLLGQHGVLSYRRGDAISAATVKQRPDTDVAAATA